MAAITTTSQDILGNGLRYDVRSGKYFRSLDFKLSKLTGGTYYEVGDIPKGFVPRNVAVVELVKGSGTFGVYLKSDTTALASRALGSAEGVTVGQVTGKNLLGAGDTVCVMVNASPAAGRVKVVISGDLMTDVWDDGDAREEIKPSDAVLTNMMD